MLFSVIIPTYNRSKIVAVTIESVLKQTFSDFEIIVVDDGSTDDTRETISEISDARVRYFYKQNEERSIARNYGADLATGEYLIFLDSDDSFVPEHLQKLSRFIRSQKEPPLFLVSAYNIVDKAGNIKKTFEKKGEVDRNELVTGNPLCCSPVTVNANLFKRFYFNTERRLIIFEDWELWLRLVSQSPLFCVPDPTVIIADHDQRSVLTTAPADLADKINFFSVHAPKKIPLLQDAKNQSRFLGSLYSYGALHMAMHKTARTRSLKFLIKSLATQPSLLLQRRLPAILKNLLLP